MPAGEGLGGGSGEGHVQSQGPTTLGRGTRILNVRGSLQVCRSR